MSSCRENCWQGAAEWLRCMAKEPWTRHVLSFKCQDALEADVCSFNTAIACCKGVWAVALDLLPMADEVGHNAAMACQGRRCLEARPFAR